jgi:uncharacterized membrane protein
MEVGMKQKFRQNIERQPHSTQRSARTIAFWRFVVGLVLVAALGVPSLAGAANTTSDRAQTLDVTSSTASDTLVGSPGGAYRYYQVAYQGGNAPVLFTLTYQPTWGGGNSTFGFNLYGPSGLS